ncbi:hypothetical protein SODG_002694 [Sodalis praecaptivus]
MKENTGSYALIPETSNRVENIIVASDDYQRQGYYTVRYDEKTFCQPGMYYNAKTGLFMMVLPLSPSIICDLQIQ